jgi:HAE1 family hydrophobic/amphiphilic exporter-1
MAKNGGPTSWLSFVTRRPVAITMFMLAMMVFGLVSLLKLPVDLLPEISYPTLTVRTTWAGAAPEDVEERISERVQEALSTLDNLVRSTSISRAGTSDVVLDFDWGTPMTFAVQDVREQLDGVFLPRDAERPLILRYDPNLDPILRIGIRAPNDAAATGDAEADLIQLRWLAEKRIKRELEALEGVAAVQVRGGLEEEIRVRVDPYKLAAKQIDPTDVAARLAQENINASSGSLLEGSAEYLVRTVNQFRTTDEIEELPLAQRGNAVIRISDVGTVDRTYQKREVISRIGGAESVEIAIYREAGANIVELAQMVNDRVFGTAEQQAAAEEIEARGKGSATTVEERNRVGFLGWRMKDQLQLDKLSDQSIFIRDAVNDVKSAAYMGALLAVAVIWMFLRRLAATLIIGVSIPLSILVTFAPMYIGGVSLNIMSLGGLALGVGMLVDNAIVVLESITRCREEGDDMATAAVRGLSEVAGAVIASTLTTVCVFAPIVFVTGIAGQIFGDQALTVVSSLMVSLVVAVLFIPMLASRSMAFASLGGIGAPIAAADEIDEDTSAAPPASRPPLPWHGLRWSWSGAVGNLLTLTGRTLTLLGGLVIRYVCIIPGRFAYRLFWHATWPIRFVFDAVWHTLDRSYPVVLRGALALPWLVLLLMGALSWVAWQRVPHLGLELLPEIHQGEFTAHTKLKVGNPLQDTDVVMRELDGEIRGLPHVETTALTVGVEKETLTREIEGPHTARLTVRLEEGGHDPELEDQISRDVRRILARHPAVDSVEITRPTPFALEDPIAVEVTGYRLDELMEVGAEVQARLAGIEGLTDVRSTVRDGHPEARVRFDREKMLEFGLDLVQVSNLVRDQVLGNVSTLFHEGDERIDIRVQGDEIVLNSLQSVLDLPVNPSSENPVLLRSVADIEIVQGPAEIRRIGNTRAVVISATGTGLDLGGISKRIEDELATMSPPRDVTVQLGGQKREMDEAQTSLRFALLLAIFLVYVVMASQFESLVQPLVILLTVPLAAVGVILSLDVLGIPLSVVVFIGLIMLAGIVVNNAIVLLDRINKKRADGLAMADAILEGGRARLRPILMTTATTVLGLLPLTGWLAGIPVIGAMGAGQGAEIRAPMAIAVITGLISSTILTLLVVPVVYSLVCRKTSVGAIAVPNPTNAELDADLL